MITVVHIESSDCLVSNPEEQVRIGTSTPAEWEFGFVYYVL